jgi:rhodanese-related sulfurtransferase
MTVKRVPPDEALRLIQEQGYVYVDVRSIPEFESGHPEGAYNVPIAHLGPAGFAPNPEFLSVMQRVFPPDTRLVLGCKAGARSLQAASMLLAAGYCDVVDQRAGFDGAPGPEGFEPGWRPSGLPVSTRPADGRGYASLKDELP